MGILSSTKTHKQLEHAKALLAALDIEYSASLTVEDVQAALTETVNSGVAEATAEIKAELNSEIATIKQTAALVEAELAQVKQANATMTAAITAAGLDPANLAESIAAKVSESAARTAAKAMASAGHPGEVVADASDNPYAGMPLREKLATQLAASFKRGKK